ncbi:MAG TPA: protein kinase, partial [Polyangia bacterium]
MTSRPHGNRVMEPGTVFGRYQIVSVRGVGGMGTVYEALHTSLRKKVAIKVLNADLAWNEEARQRFLREGELAAQIQHHHVVDVHDVGTVDELPYLVMEYLDGEDLGALIAREGALGVSRTLDILLPIMA